MVRYAYSFGHVVRCVWFIVRCAKKLNFKDHYFVCIFVYRTWCFWSFLAGNELNADSLLLTSRTSPKMEMGVQRSISYDDILRNNKSASANDNLIKLVQFSLIRNARYRTERMQWSNAMYWICNPNLSIQLHPLDTGIWLLLLTSREIRKMQQVYWIYWSFLHGRNRVDREKIAVRCTPLCVAPPQPFFFISSWENNFWILWNFMSHEGWSVGTIQNLLL